jgi:hypothetical protein
MILLVTPSERASDCTAALQAATGDQVMTAESLARATTLLRAHCYRLVVLDQHLLEAEPDEASTMVEHLGTAIPVPVNLAITGMDRLDERSPGRHGPPAPRRDSGPPRCDRHAAERIEQHRDRAPAIR